MSDRSIYLYYIKYYNNNEHNFISLRVIIIYNEHNLMSDRSIMSIIFIRVIII